MQRLGRRDESSDRERISYAAAEDDESESVTVTVRGRDREWPGTVRLDATGMDLYFQISMHFGIFKVSP